MTAVCRRATEQDVEQLYELILGYSLQGIMLPRSRDMLRDQLHDFVVAEADGELIGCGSLTQLGQELVEIRSLGILPTYKGRGVGTMIVDELLEMAKTRSLPRVMALTYEVRFFEKNGFEVVEKDIFPEKVWTDCVHCKKRHACDEIAVLKILE
ncbi:N-acetyltransferase [Paenibacillus aquistagni]|uniref:N-acetylglutamate synthase n=1 Tax=Paenibacillus aquistagni TaxID=1852522 RepID=A0A1X7IDG1_9BACL|nr:N-acetyltransferase [Paenibacillus aquistagni]NMM51540.1 N-acetyltransferase [Paenibacillus aquistagni]SMG12187.1 N-acetylglutamate synthase [Paenibacillus aquistagni]